MLCIRFVFCFVLGLATVTAAADKLVLNVYTYDSFSSQWGPGPAIKTAFESQCDCELNFVAVDGSTGILSRIQLEGANSRADVMLGMDAAQIADARKTKLLAPHGVDLAQLNLPVAWQDKTFLPFDFGYFAFIYNADKLANPPQSFRELLEADELKILIQDPRSSTPGLGLLLWVKALYGERAFGVWQQLADNIVTVTKGWSESYGLFLDGEADMVLSYTTSPAYHIHTDDKHQYRAAAFAEGHGLQVEVAAQLKSAPSPKLAAAFMRFITSENFQAVIPTGNWMYPVREISAGLPAAFDGLVQPRAALQIPAREVAANRANWVDEFNRALSDAP